VITGFVVRVIFVCAFRLSRYRVIMHRNRAFEKQQDHMKSIHIIRFEIKELLDHHLSFLVSLLGYFYEK
jgi:hypothetical protein